ncbi:MAG: hypothetical protein ABSG70_13160 [Terriglobales bacterium]|jgi:hypothetical protein
MAITTALRARTFWAPLFALALLFTGGTMVVGQTSPPTPMPANPPSANPHLQKF